MDKLLIEGPAKLKGEVLISGSKNAALPIMAATLLNDNQLVLENIPSLRDIKSMIHLLADLGVKIKEENLRLTINASSVKSYEANYDLVRKMRASILVLGPLLARFKQAKVSLPGGCAIGTRPIDIHLEGLKKLGAEIELEAGYVNAKTKGLRGAKIDFPFPSVGATENIIMAAVLAKGTTTISNAAREPEIIDLANFLNKQGAKISGAGNKEIVIEGVVQLKSAVHKIISDRIEAATYTIAGLITGSEITIKNVQVEYLTSVLKTLESMGAKFECTQDSIKVLPCKKLRGVEVVTAPYPEFPTDVQAQLMALTCVSDSSSIIMEQIFENRFMHVSELRRLGARIKLELGKATITGNTNFVAAPVMCTDLRASAALVLAALRAKGKTEISRVYHLDRGYENIDEKLVKLGVEIKRTN